MKLERVIWIRKEIENGLLFLEKLKQVFCELSIRICQERERALKQNNIKMHKINCFNTPQYFNLIEEKIHRMHNMLDGMRTQFERFCTLVEVAQENLEAMQSGAYFASFSQN